MYTVYLLNFLEQLVAIYKVQKVENAHLLFIKEFQKTYGLICKIIKQQKRKKIKSQISKKYTSHFRRGLGRLRLMEGFSSYKNLEADSRLVNNTDVRGY